MKKLIGFTNKISNITGILSGIVLVGTALMIFINVVARRLFNAPLFGANEISCYLCLAAASLALPMTEWLDNNIKMTLIHENVSVQKARLLDLISNIICVPVLVFISVQFMMQAYSKYLKADKTVELGIPIFVASGLIAICLILLTVVSTIKLIVRINSMRTGVEFDFRQGEQSEADQAVTMAAQDDSLSLNANGGKETK